MLWADYLRRASAFFAKNETDWQHTRLIVAAFTGQKPTDIIKLSCDKVRINWDSDAYARFDKMKDAWLQRTI